MTPTLVPARFDRNGHIPCYGCHRPVQVAETLWSCDAPLCLRCVLQYKQNSSNFFLRAQGQRLWEWWKRRARVLAGAEDVDGLPIPRDHFEHDRMPFQRKSEVVVYEALKVMQRAMPMLILPNARVRPPGPFRVPDIIVVKDGKAAAIEVDGPSHIGRRDLDNLRDQYLEDNGLLFVRHVSEEHALNPDALQRFLDRFIARLERG